MDDRSQETSPTCLFEYESLPGLSKQFRLIAILAGQHDDALHCTLSHEDLEDDPVPEYESISYCWGDANDRSAITLNGVYISVPASTAAALRRVRLQHHDRVVWLDAVCINQESLDERSQQVGMMGDIYRNARTNLIYLGEDNITEAMRSIQAILKEAEETEGSFSLLRNEVGAWQYSSTPIKADYSAEALIKFFDIPWFRRVWVLQEAALARENRCFCGGVEFDLVNVTRVAAWLVYNYYYVDADLRLGCSYTADMNDLVDSIYGYHRRKSGHAAGALYLLDLTQQRLATNAVDKLYGILGLTTNADGETHLDVVPDYRKPIGEAFRDAAWCLIKAGDMTLLDYIRHRPSAGEIGHDQFPSWVPKWHIGKDLEEDPNFMSLLFEASANRISSAPTLNQKEASNEIVTDGLMIDTIKSSTTRITTEMLAKTDTLKSLLAQINEMITKVDLENDTLSLASALVAGVDVNYKPVTAEIESGYQALLSSIGKQQILPPSISNLRRDSGFDVISASQYLEAMRSACMNRAFFVTERGHFGLGPWFMKQNDVVAILYGLKFPVVLRPIGDRHQFLGTCYVHGMMKGEALSKCISNGDDLFVLF